jgi:hypothetical protein
MSGMTQADIDAIAAAIREVMGQIRADVAAGVGANIEADAVAIGIAYEIARYLEQHRPDFDRDAFLEACDVTDLIPSEAFHD